MKIIKEGLLKFEIGKEASLDIDKCIDNSTKTKTNVNNMLFQRKTFFKANQKNEEAIKRLESERNEIRAESRRREEATRKQIEAETNRFHLLLQQVVLFRVLCLLVRFVTKENVKQQLC